MKSEKDRNNISGFIVDGKQNQTNQDYLIVNIKKYADDDWLEEAVDILSKGGIVIYPTDTLYGFGVDATNDSALKKLSTLKGRKKPWSIIVSDLEMLNRFASVTPEHQTLIENELPGKVTVILQTDSSELSANLLGPNKSIGIRIPNHLCPTSLVQKLGFPITTTSVNKGGEQPLNDPDQIITKFKNSVDMIIDDGILPPSSGSKILDLMDKEVKILRN
tara:strand:+ start:27181 stop:27837 length:657 start_codon:yes stop_codon:yes gene_type:complete